VVALDCQLDLSYLVVEASRELEADCRHAPLFLFLSQVLKIVVFSHREWQHSKQELHVRQELLVVDPRSHEFTRMNLSALPFLVRLCRWSVVRYLEKEWKERKSTRSISSKHEARVWDWFEHSGE
jgi:hypothetical protein